MLAISTALLFLSSTLGVLASIINSGDFVFPLEKSEDFSSCKFQNGSAGRCVNIRKCQKVHDEYILGINPTVCHFEENGPVVCCMTVTEYPLSKLMTTPVSTTLRPLFEYSSDFVVIGPTSNFPSFPEVKNSTQFVPSEQLVTRRKSVTNCEDVYSLPVPFDNPGDFHVTIVGGQVTSVGEFPHMVRCSM